MKLAVHMSMFCNTWRDDITPFFPMLKRIGYDAVEVSLYGVEEKEAVRTLNAASKAGLGLLCGTGLSRETDVSSHDPAVRRKGIEYLKNCIDMAAGAGAAAVNGILYAPWQSFAAGRDREERAKCSAGSLYEAGIYAQSKNIQLNCEVINRFEGDMLNTLNEGSAFLKRVGLPNVKLLADVFHMNIEEADMGQAIKQNKEDLGCIHICENHRGIPGTGMIDWTELLFRIHESGYDGYLDLESFVNTGTEVGDAMYLWRNRGDSPLAEAEKAYQYIIDKLRVVENEQI